MWAGEQGCCGSTVCFVRLCPARSAPGTAQGPLPDPIAGAMLVWTSSLGHHDVSYRRCAHRKNILGNVLLFQVLSLLMAFTARERMINLYAITATSFWYHDTQALCHRPVIGFHWVEEAYFTSRVQLRLWLVWSIKIFHELFSNSLGWKGPLVAPGPSLAHTAPA